MAYFPNGTSAIDYEETYCIHCIHHGGPDGVCAIMDAHMMFNYDECNNDKSILNILIPQTADGLGNKECAMFKARDPLKCRLTTDLFETTTSAEDGAGVQRSANTDAGCSGPSNQLGQDTI